MPRKPSVQFLAGMGNQECSSKGCEGGLLSEFQKSTSINKLSCNKEQVFEPGETRFFDKGGLSNDRQKSDNSSSKGHFPGILQSVLSCPQTRKEMATNNRSECGNKYLHIPTFKMETAENIRDSLQGEWVTSLDLIDAYFHIPIHPWFKKYLHFNVGDRSCQFTALPFGIATAPHEFTMVAKEVKLMALAEGIRIHQYIDDWLMRTKTKQQCRENTHRLIHLVQSLGWIINFEKSDLIPTQEIKFLGYKFDLRVGLVFPTQKKIDRLLEKTVSMLESPQTSPRKLMSLIGSMASMEKTIPLGRLHMRPLQWYLKTHWRYPQSLDIPVPVSQVLKQHLQWWTNLSNLKRGSPLHQKEHNLLFTDASLKGWGAHLKHYTASGL